MNAALAAEPPMTATPRTAAQPSLSFLLRHQWKTEARLLRFPLLIWAVVWLLRTLHLLHPDAGAFSRHLDLPIDLLTIMTACWLVFVSIRADAPASSNTASRTRPIGQTTLWISKILSLLVFIALPWLAGDLVAASGFSYSLREWLGLAASSLLLSTLVIAAAAALLSLAATPRQTTVLLFAGTLTALAWIIALQGWLQPAIDIFTTTLPSQSDTASTRQTCAGIISVLLALPLVILSWRLSMVHHRKRLAALVFTLAAIQQPITQKFWPHDWLTPDPHPYAGSPTLSVVSEPLPPWTPATDCQLLSPHASLHHLAPDETASIVALAPITPSTPWPPTPYYSDFNPASRQSGSDTWDEFRWLRFDHLRIVSKTYPQDHLWIPWLYEDDSTRFPKQLSRITRLDPTSLAKPWRMRLAIHGMRKIADIPMRDLMSKPQRFPIRPGLRLELDPIDRPHWTAELRGRIRQLRPMIIRPETHTPLRISGHRLPDNLLLIIHDPVTGQNVSSTAVPSAFQYGIPFRQPSIRWIDEEARYFTFGLPEPDARYALSSLTFETWTARSLVQIWLPEERGIVDLEITPDQMRQLTR